jgi:hypothetical protein
VEKCRRNLTTKSSALYKVHLVGRHCCFYCTIEMKTPLGQREPSPLRTLETLDRDHSLFMGSGGNIKKAKEFNNVIGSVFFRGKSSTSIL